MRSHTLPRTAALGGLAAAVALSGLGANAATSSTRAAGADPAATQARDGAPAALRFAVRAVGGAEDLRGLRSFRYTASSQRWILDEAQRPGVGAEPAATVESTVRYVMGTRRARPRVRIDSVRTSLGTARPVHEVLRGRRGFIRGVDANFSASALKPMTSDRWAAIHSEQALLNPHVLLRQALRRPQTARNGGVRRVGGSRYRVLVLRNNVAPIRMFISTRTGRLARLRTMQHDYLRRDVLVDVRYRRWARAGNGLRFPRLVTLRSDGEPMVRETRNDPVTNPTVRARAFRFPSSLGPAPYRARLARIGARTSQWLMSFVNLGFIKDGGQTAINRIAITDGTNTAEGMTLLGGVANNSLVIQRDTGVVVFEGALHDHRAEAVIRFIRRSPAFTGPITHVVTTHHHADHAGGMRPYAALGATAVVGRQAVTFFRRVFRDRGSTILPDRLDRRPNVRARILGVPAAGRSLAVAGQEIDVEVFPLRTDHATDMVVPYVRDQGVLFTSDIYSPPGLPDPDDPTAQAIAAMVEAQGLDPEWIVGGHGTFIAWADFAAALGVQ